MIPDSIASHAVLRVAIALFLCSGSFSGTAQTTLKLPQTSADYKALAKDTDGKPCTTCGVVTSLRTRSAASVSGTGAASIGSNPGFDSGPGVDTATVPIGKGGFAKPAQPSIIHVISVKFDNGSYSLVEQNNEPRLKLGQRVRVIDGRVEPE